MGWWSAVNCEMFSIIFYTEPIYQTVIAVTADNQTIMTKKEKVIKTF